MIRDQGHASCIAFARFWEPGGSRSCLEAIRYGDRPEARAQLHQVIDDQIGEGLDKLPAERALHRDLLTAADVE